MTDEMIEQVAREICKAHGLDPDKMVNMSDHASDTVAQSMQRATSYGMSFTEPLWMMFRKDASAAIAAEIAIAKVMRGKTTP